MSTQGVGRNGPRSKTGGTSISFPPTLGPTNAIHFPVGCSTCRRRKVKCGEEKPTCARCASLRLNCEWGVPVKHGRSTLVRHLQPAPRAPEQTPWPMPEAGPPIDSHSDDLLTFLSPVSWAEDILPFDTSHSAPTLSPLYPSLNFNTACGNSLTLSSLDRQYFQYFPSSSLVFYYMKGWRWTSNLAGKTCGYYPLPGTSGVHSANQIRGTDSYLYQGPAASNRIIMRMLLALAACDMHRNGLAVGSQDHGRYHYSQAVKEFRQLLETPRQVSLHDIEMVFATVFLMIAWEWQFGHSMRHLQLHLQGVRSLLESHPQLFRIKDVTDILLSPETNNPSNGTESMAKVSFIPEQFLLWPDHLHRCARLWGRCFWGGRYPDEEVLDDIENYRALELLHAGYSLRHRTWKALIESATGTADSAEALFSEILAIRDKFADLFITAKFAGSVSNRRTVNTIYLAVSTFYGQVLLHRRLLCVNDLPAGIHQQATTGIIDISQKQFMTDPKHLFRLHWPLLMAIIETSDALHQQWLRDRLWELRDFHSEFCWAYEVAEQILAQQDLSRGRYVNLANVLLDRFHAQ
ncbi:uncharacterized protein N7515_010336 [Penicillium bovifimosum]|uniref:Zn(2)-C6 fungal-type domain-containing protein n=1 Tax=Penicillium bovifimosum TaxID=126998 RepID=A0A9W9GI71_9EURO|nr:uncharacterized protein N7515_010336 [Penicillium bovifimosum]KAJ5120948.1 hypothetical protein N7515_010336 [Penicillium bovifimosum]